MKKTLLIIGAVLGGLLVFIGLIVGIVYYFTLPVAQSSDKFFALVKENRAEEAYALTSDGFHEATSLNQFKSFLKQSKLDTYESAFWSNRSIQQKNNNSPTAFLGGTVATSDKKNIALGIDFIYENDAWKVHHIKLDDPIAGLEGQSIPDIATQNKLIKTTLADFRQAVKKENFDDFYAHISDLWKSQTTAEELLKTFTAFIEKKINIDFIDVLEPTIEEDPIIDENGMLSINGYFSVPPESQEKMLNDIKVEKIHFQLGYINEDSNWKLFKIRLSLKSNTQQDEGNKQYSSLDYFKKNLKKEMSIKEMTETFGEPDRDIGSGIHIFVYTLDDGSEINLGHDGEKFLYANHGKDNLIQYNR